MLPALCSQLFARSVVPDGIEPSFPACKTGVVAVGPQDRISVERRARSMEWEEVLPVPRSLLPAPQHAPKDLNPDLLGWNQQCYRYTKDASQKSKWERKELHLSPSTTQFKAEGLQPPVWKRSRNKSVGGRCLGCRSELCSSPLCTYSLNTYGLVTSHQAEAVGLEPTTV